MSSTPSAVRTLLIPLLVPVVTLAVTATLAAGAMSSAHAAAPAAAPAAGLAASPLTRAALRHHTTNLRVASFNIQSVGLDQTRGLQRPWKQRRTRVISQILDERVDVLGIQEANPAKSFAHRLVDGPNQYLDLRNGLNRHGGHYAVTNVNAVNCLNPTTGYRCKPRNRAASFSERILYNTRAVTLLHRGAMRYRAQGAGRTRMYLTWAFFRSKANGRQFLFTSTHLDTAHREVRRAQWKQMITRINCIKRHRLVIAVGDFNTTKFDPLDREMLPAMKHAGYGDVLNQQYRVNPTRHVRARSQVNGWLSTFNFLTRDVRRFGATRAQGHTGNGIDYIFATNSLKVLQYKVVLDFNPRTFRVVGVLPSDHNMIRATIALPAA
jgi:endonuclease/exonuclease/phosphatase family metal-dependent hydrolase